MKRFRTIRTYLKLYLPRPVVKLIVKIKGGGVLERPTEVKPQNTDSLLCTIAYNQYGSFCTPDSCKYDEPVQATYRCEQYEEETIKYIKSLKLSGDIIHAGAYFGDTLPGLSQAVGEGSQVWAFEPNPESFRCAEVTLLLNKLKNVALFNLGIGDKAGQLNLKIRKDDSSDQAGGTARIVLESGNDTVEVSVKRLDDIIPEDRFISLIHLDVEGFESAALKGAGRILGKFKPIIITELNNLTTKNMMAEFGYKFVLGLEQKTWQEGYRNALFKHESTLSSD